MVMKLAWHLERNWEHIAEGMIWIHSRQMKRTEEWRILRHKELSELLKWINPKTEGDRNV
jgi:hypothetical protein